MSYTVIKPINLAGKRRVIGEVIEKEELVDGRVYSLIKSGYISEIKEFQKDNANASKMILNTKEQNLLIPIKAEEPFEIEISAQEIVDVFEILQETVEVATERIKNIEKEEVLILIDATDSRKGIRNAVLEQVNNIKEGDM